MPEEIYRKIFSKNLNYYMNLYHKTQSDLVNDLQLNKSAVSTWCNGTRLPRMDKVDLLAKYFGINRSDLIEEHTEKESLPQYYLNEDAKEMAEFMFKNPEYKVLFDASRKVKKEDINFVKEMMDRIRGNADDTEY